MPQYERGENPTIDKMVDDAVMKLVTEANGTMLREPVPMMLVSTASVDLTSINQRGSYKWSNESPILMSTGNISPGTLIPATRRLNEYAMAVEFERMQTASESKQPPKVEDLPPVFKREIDL